MAGLHERADLGADRAGVVWADVQPRAGGEPGRGDVAARLRRLGAALDLPPAEADDLGGGGCGRGIERSCGKHDQRRDRELGKPTAGSVT